MLEWLNKIKRNSNISQNNDSQISYSEQAKTLIEKWMKLNGINDISFDEYIKQLGLDYIDIINIDYIDLNLSDSMWDNPNFMGALCFKNNGFYSGYDVKFDLDGKNGFFVPELNKLNRSMNITNIIYLFKNSLSAKISVSRSEYGDRFKHVIHKDFDLLNDKKLNEIKEVISFKSDESYYDKPRYQYIRTTENTKSFIRVDDIRENTGINVYINGEIIEFNDKEVRGKLWFSDKNYLKSILDDLLERVIFEKEVSIKIDAIPGFDNIIYTRDKNGNVIIKETSKKRQVYFSFDNIQTENLFTKRLTVVCNKKRINLDIISTNEIEICNLNKLISHIYDLYDGIFGINECFNKISSISFKNPDDSLIRVILTEESDNNVIKSKEWSRQYRFDNSAIESDNSMILRK